MSEPLRFLIGPTAVGKSALALAWASAHHQELISLDSMQVYRGMDLGTAKPSAAERARVVHHMLDLVDPTERYDVQRYLADLEPVQRSLSQRAAAAIHVGGTGFYLKARLAGLFEGPAVDAGLRAQLEQRYASEGAALLHEELARIDPPSALRIHAHDKKRLVRALEVYQQTGRALSAWQEQWTRTPRPARIVGLELPVAELDARILQRVRQMLDQGWVEEVRALEAKGWLGPTAIQAIGYREVRALSRGECTLEDCAQAIALSTRQFARRQRTWWRKFPVTWFEAPKHLSEMEASELSSLWLDRLARVWES